MTITMILSFFENHWVLTTLGLVILLAILSKTLTGAVLISERQVGIVVKRCGAVAGWSPVI